MKRPWQGQVEVPPKEPLNAYDEHCYLCPNNKRVNGELNDNYSNTFVFINDFSALQHDTPMPDTDSQQQDKLLKMDAVNGESRVVCFSPHHSKTLPLLSIDEIDAVVKTWRAECDDLGQRYQWVQLFENKGEMMGCSNPHPHSQIWAQQQLPSIVSRKQQALSRYWSENQSNLLADYAERELNEQERLVITNDHWLAVVPYWASWPFETILLPRFNIARFNQLDDNQSHSLADILKQLTIKYDNLFQCSFPYSMGWHGAPYDNKTHPEWSLHASFYPPLLFSSRVRKFMVGYEMLAEAQRDLAPEQAAVRLRNSSSTHYLDSQFKKNNE